jgi:hypothetical protein
LSKLLFGWIRWNWWVSHFINLFQLIFTLSVLLIITEIILILIRIVNVSKIILIGSVFWNERFFHLSWHVILLIKWSRLQVNKRFFDMTCWKNFFCFLWSGRLSLLAILS